MNEQAPAVGGFSKKARIATIAINYIPFLHTLAIVATVALMPGHPGARVGVTLALLYLAPPILFRVISATAPVRRSRIPVGSSEFFRWWAGHQTQVIFSRFGCLEEALRLIPGLYSLWLRLWGSKIGANTYWTAGTSITDRAYLDIGDNVTLGAGVRLNSHVILRNDAGEMELVLAPVTLGAGALVGGYSLLTAGTTVEAGSVTRAMLLSPPFSRWENNRRRRDPNEP